jgi:tetratricopeptide (TPR) repeat protein
MPSFGISLTPCGSNSSQHYSYQEVPTAYDRKVLEKALSECRTLPKGNTNADLGKILGKKGLIQQADQIIQSYNTGISPRDQWELTYRMAQILTANGDSQEAIEVLEEIIEIDPLELVNPHKIEMSEQMQNEAREMNNLKYHLSSLYTMLLVETEDHPSLRSFLFVKPGEFQQGSDIHFRLLIEAANISMRTGKWRLAAVFFERGLTLREYHPPALTADAESQIGLALTICRDNLKYEREEPSESDSSDHKNPS